MGGFLLGPVLQLLRRRQQYVSKHPKALLGGFTPFGQ